MGSLLNIILPKYSKLDGLGHGSRETCLRWLVLVLVCMSGLAYDQVEIPQKIYTLYGYISLVLCILLQVHRHTQFLKLWTIPVLFFIVKLIWYFMFGGNLNPQFLLLLLCCEILSLHRDEKTWIMERFRTFIVWMSVAGILSYCSYMFGLGLPFKLKPFYMDDWPTFYINYHISYLLGVTPGASGMNFIPRLCGLYNEPGFFGTIAIFVLCIDNLNLRRIGNIAILIAGVLSFSFAFWVILILYWLIRDVSKLPRLFTKLAVLIVIFSSIQLVHFEEPRVQALVERFQIKDGKLAGDNRVTDKFQKVYNRMFIENKEMFGVGPEVVAKMSGNLSAKTYILTYGIIGFLLLWGTAIYLSIGYARTGKCPTSRALVYIAIFFISTYQRPHFITPLYLTLLFAGIDYIEQQAYMQKIRISKVGRKNEGATNKQRHLTNRHG